MNDWQTYRLGDHCQKIGSGATPRGGSEVYQESGIPFIRSQNIYNNYFDYSGLVYLNQNQAHALDNVTVQSGDILLNITGDSVARANQVPMDVIPARVNQHVAIIRPNSDVFNARFVRYYLVSPAMQSYMLGLASSGGTRNALTKGMIEDFRIPYPPLHEQRAIAHVLGALDDKIELNRRMNVTLEEMARTLFRSWFVDFEPVKAKEAGQTPEGMDAEMASLFPDEFEDSEIGRIPKGWRVEPFDASINLIGGGTPKTSVPEYWDGDIPWFSVVDAPSPSDIFVIDTEKHITHSGLSNSSARLLRRGTSIISARGTVGRCALVGHEMAINQSCYAVQGKYEETDYFTYFSLRYLVTELQQRTHGSIFDTITRETFNEVKRVFPSLCLAQEFDKTLVVWMDLLKTNLVETKSLTELRDTLLPKLISGEVRLSQEVISQIDSVLAE